MQLIIFELQNKRYALEAASVVEMTRLVAVTQLAHLTPPCVGVINYHGKLIPVLQPEADFMLGLENHRPPQNLTLNIDNQMIILQDATQAKFCLIVDRILTFAETQETWNLTETASNDYQPGLVGKLTKLDSQIIPVFAIETLGTLSKRVLEWQN